MLVSILAVQLTFPLWGRALTPGTEEGVDSFLETFSLPECNDFPWEFISQAIGKNVLLWLAVCEYGIATVIHGVVKC